MLQMRSTYPKLLERYTLARGAAVTEILEAYKMVENLRNEEQETRKKDQALATPEAIAA